MIPSVLAFVTIGPGMLVVGLALGYFLFAGKSSPPVVLTDADLEKIAMAVFAELEQPLADLDAAVVALPDKVAAAVAAGADPAAAQDKADTIAAVQTSLGNATTAINAVGQ